MAGYGRYVFNFLRDNHIFLQSDCTILHSHQHCMKVGKDGESSPISHENIGGRRKAVRDRLALQGGTGDFP